MEDTQSAQSRASSHIHVPRPLTQFIGREEVLDLVASELAVTTRLVTITGPGGTGKTRLSMEVAARVADRFPGGVYMVELAPLSDPHAIPSHIASALGVRLRGRTLSEAVIEHFEESLLLLLDNCEHLIDECAEIATALLEQTDYVNILATSREALDIAGEVVQPLRPMYVPAPEAEADLKAVASVESVQLFVERARQRDPNFALTKQNTHAVAEICRALDGIPLAIELAAARINVLTPEEIAARLGDRYQILTRSSRSAEPRQRTFQALVDWSYNLLTETEQILWQRLSVFEPSVPLEDVEAVVADDRLPAHEVLDTLSRLVDKSIVTATTDAGVTWYRMLETLRQYGLHRLNASGEGALLRRRHRDYYADFIAKVNEKYREQYTGLAPSLPEVRSRISNVIAAVRYSTTQPDSPTALAMSFPLAAYYYATGQQTYGYELLREIVDLPGSQGETRDRALVLIGMGQLARVAGRGDEAVECVQDGLAIARRIGDSSTVQVGLIQLAQVLLPSQTARKVALLEELLAIATHWSKVVTGHGILAYLSLCMNDLEQAGSHSRLALAAAKGHEGTFAYAYACAMTGFLGVATGAEAEAIPYLRDSLQYMQANHQSNAAETWLLLARCYQRTGDNQNALRALREGLSVLHDTLHDPGMTANFVPWTFLLLTSCDMESAALPLLEAAGELSAATFDFSTRLQDALRTATDRMRSRWSSDDLRAAAAPVSATNARTWLPAVTQAVEAELQKLGQAKTDEGPNDGVGGVEAGDEPTDAQLTGKARAGSGRMGKGLAGQDRVGIGDDLTERELTVLQMLAKGFTNKEIANQLFLTEGTVRTYLSRVYDKLGAKSRTDAVAIALETGLFKL